MSTMKMHELTGSRCRFPVRKCVRQCTVPARRTRATHNEFEAARRPCRCCSDRNLSKTNATHSARIELLRSNTAASITLLRAALSKTAERIDVMFEVETSADPRNTVYYMMSSSPTAMRPLPNYFGHPLHFNDDNRRY